MASLSFAPWISDIELGFYSALAKLKIDHDRLKDDARKIIGLYEIKQSDPPNISGRMQIRINALKGDDYAESNIGYRAEGTLKNFNTYEEFKSADRTKILDLAARTIWDAIQDETIYECPSLLSSFYAIFFADLKKFNFTYHFAFPALHSDPAWKLVEGEEPSRFGPKETTMLVEAVQTWRYSVDSRQHGFFLAKRMYQGQLVKGDQDDAENSRPKTPQTPGLQDELGFSWAVASLSSFKRDFFKGVDPKDQYICFADPSTYPTYCGWMLRNLLVLVRQLFRLDNVQILSYRDSHIRRDQPHSLILHLQSASPTPTEKLQEMPKVTGWERNKQNKVAPRVVPLRDYMDNKKIADQAVDLNLKLIKWRIAPTIDLEVIKNTKCLLLGAGTLGSYVSRNLMGWGVRKITFIDNATVSFSNPVRQPLFNFEDCLKGGAKKATRAAAALQEIYPGVDAQGHVMSVPMAGHPILDEAKVKEEYEKLKELIDEHDVIFLLLDTRESRWLPTLMGKAAGKIVMTSALGFDTFVVMRHGLKARGSEEEEVGCYFCNDVVAPADSLKDATLDQQCTVTRPGIAPIASALLVELMVSILQHPLRARAPATSDSSTTTGLNPHDPTPFTHPLGAVPHQIRGFLSTFSNMSIKGQPYDCCSACSDNMIAMYKEGGWDFVKRAINEKGWVEEISGLAEVQRTAAKLDDELDWDDSDGGDFEDGDGELMEKPHA